ncbi:hypothetical protein Q0Z83_038780 [Actinoplanes sichuanensis]|nr:hypothetical protein Q0Z83_038780 [Actinoplanes sichuanensis]
MVVRPSLCRAWSLDTALHATRFGGIRETQEMLGCDPEGDSPRRESLAQVRFDRVPVQMYAKLRRGFRCPAERMTGVREHLTDHGRLRSGLARSQIMIEATVTVAS